MNKKLPKFYSDRFLPLDLVGEALPSNEEFVNEAEHNYLPESMTEESVESEAPETFENQQMNNNDRDSTILACNVYSPNFTDMNDGGLYGGEIEDYDMRSNNPINYEIAEENMNVGSPPAMLEMTTVNQQGTIDATPKNIMATPKAAPRATPKANPNATPKATPIATPRAQTETPRRSFSIRRTGPRRKHVQSDELAAIRAAGMDLLSVAPYHKAKKVLEYLES